jgi:hypothetical protein
MCRNHPQNNEKKPRQFMANYDAPGLTYDSGVLYDAPDLPQPPRKRMAQISLGLARLSVADLLQVANNIKTAMTGNTNFTTPNPALTAIGTLITNLTGANNTYQASLNAAKENLTLRDDAMAALVAGLNSLAAYVQNVSGGDAAKIQSAGMSVKGARTPATMPDTVASLSIPVGDNAGELDLQWDPANGAKTYDVQISPDPITATSWVAQPSVTKSKTVVLGLTSGAKVWARVRAVGPGGTGAWSEVATKIVP